MSEWEPFTFENEEQIQAVMSSRVTLLVFRVRDDENLYTAEVLNVFLAHTSKTEDGCGYKTPTFQLV